MPPAQPLSLVFVKDLAGAVVHCLSNGGASRKVFFVAHPEVVTAEWMAQAIARTMSTWTVPVPIPMLLLSGLCLLNEGIARMTSKPRVLSLGKIPEIRAPAWVCDPTRLRTETGYECSTSAQAGLRQTLDWYRKEGWL